MSQRLTNISGKAAAVIHRVDFNKPKLCERTTPVLCKIGGIEVPIIGQQNWVQLYVAIIEKFIRERNKNLNELYKRPLISHKKLKKHLSFLIGFFSQRKDRTPFFMNSPITGRNCVQLSNGKWIDANFSIPNLVKRIGLLCQYCGVYTTEIEIDYVEKEYQESGNALNPIASPTFSKDEKGETVSLGDDFSFVASQVLFSRFVNGIRIDSGIELERFRLFANEDCSVNIGMSDSELKNALLSCGTLFDGKLYLVTEKTKVKLIESTDLAFDNGAKIIFYESFYEQNERWLFDEHIVSAEMLEAILREICTAYFYERISFTKEYNVSLRSAIADCFNEATILSYTQISERIPYAPISKIKQVLAANSEFIWNATDIYTHISRLVISENNKVEIRKFVADKLATNTYVSASDLPLSEISEQNPELSKTALRNGVYLLCLDDKYERRGNIITLNGSKLDAATIMEEYCLSRDSGKLDELLAFEKEICGSIHRWIPMNAAYKTMVRTEQNLFVAENRVSFEIDAIDNTIELFCPGDYVPLQSITVLTAFPFCGHPWNLYLLESFCRRFSRKFRFDVLAVNSRCAGVIVRKTCSLSYRQIMADAVANSAIELSEKKVIAFLFDNGYIGRRSLSNVDELITEAKLIQERGR
ncbi:MAG: hypothetical protein CVU88_01280 [Firmicutes bacterium HGW-Firmicutes-13]|nr:MAG: hypothetical protein CVU88_01280 [Firmicutes bacterium HGW-Firmicutes-13]